MKQVSEVPLSLTVADVKHWLLQNEAIVIVDIRPARSFETGFITGAIAICAEDNITNRLQELQLQKHPTILVTDTAISARLELLKNAGYEIIGFLNDGMIAWNNLNEPIDVLIGVETDELALDIKFDEQVILIDLRNEDIFDIEHIAQSVNIPLHELKDPASMANLEDHQNIYVFGADAFSGITACSLIKKQGIHNLRYLMGGWPAIKAMPNIFEFVQSPSKNDEASKN
ncbi:MAG: rhodanese-like domain-containing protein [Bacteroidota bacterium]|jgi:rhodanese-related sulfurtransferase|nr:rhodanese-like domain-containing protein [Bacteroidota bacterium]